MTSHMNYEVLRSLVKNGDVVSIYSTITLRDFFPLLVRIFTGSPVYHTALAIWMKSPNGIDRLMLIETHATGAGKRLIPLSHYMNFKFDVTPCPGDFSKMEEHMLARVADQPYGYWDLICIGIREFFGADVGDSDRQVCSELVAEILQHGGVPLTNLHLSPGRLKGDLAKLGHVPTISVNM